MAIRFDSEDQLKKLGFKPVSKTLWVPDIRTGNRRKSSKLERDSRYKPKKKARNKTEVQGRFRVRYEVYRKRLLDYSNICYKWYEDKLVEHGILPDDTAKYVDAAELVQYKCKKGEKERVVIKVYRIG